jgi:large subunit ribosomal protein L19
MIFQDILNAVVAPVNPNIPELFPGDLVSVHVKIKEGDRERIQEYKGTVMFIKNAGVNSTFTVRRQASNGIGVERSFLTRSPRIDKVVVERHNKVRRARMYFLRERTGKSARLKQKFGIKEKVAKVAKVKKVKKAEKTEKAKEA